MKILTINGIRTDGSASTDKLGGELSRLGFDVVDVNYPRVNIFTARSRKRQYKNAKHLVNKSHKGDILIAHSYGCLLALRAMELGAQFSHVFFFAPAMNRDFIFPYLGMKNLTVIHNHTDQAIKMGNWLWFHDFGKMGSLGYNGAPDPRIANILDSKGREGKRNHSHYFNDTNIKYWTNFIRDKIQ